MRSWRSTRATVSSPCPGCDGVIAYRRAGRYLIQLGGPFAATGDRAALLGAFVADAAARRRRVVAVQLQEQDAELYAGHDFVVNQLGASYAVDLAPFTLKGGAFMRLRNKISRAPRNGVVITDCQASAATEVAAIDRLWLRAKGRHVKELEFLVGELGGPAQPHRRLFLGTVGGDTVGYISYSPVCGTRPGWLHDLSRRLPQAPPGAMEAMNMAAIEAFRASGAAWLHFGFTPFAGLDPAPEPARPAGRSPGSYGCWPKNAELGDLSGGHPGGVQAEMGSAGDPAGIPGLSSPAFGRGDLADPAGDPIHLT